MLDIEEINEEIEKLENKEYLTYDICEKLAILYTVRNNYKPKVTNNSELPSPMKALV